MDRFDTHSILEALCKATNRWGMYVDFRFQAGQENHWSLGFDEIAKAAPYLDPYKHTQILADGQGWFLFDSEEECDEAFWNTVGDDGPTKTNPYNGPVKVYALTCAPDGQLSNENT